MNKSGGFFLPEELRFHLSSNFYCKIDGTHFEEKTVLAVCN